MNKEKETVIKENKMGTMPINKLIINMSLPLITSMFVQAFYNIVDSLFVSRINEEALTAVSMSFPAQNLMISDRCRSRDYCTNCKIFRSKG